jgi:hypothetical protein
MNGYAFIDSRFIEKVFKKLLDVKLKPLPIPCSVRGFNGKQGMPITHFVRLTLDIDRQYLLRIPFLIVGLGEHDMILGRKWASHQDLLIDYKNQALVWLTRLPPSRHFNKVIACSRATLFPRCPSCKDRQHQRDANCRDALMKMKSWCLMLLCRGDTPGFIWAKDKKKQLMVMEFELSGRPSSETAFLPKRLSSRIELSAPYTIDIAAISPHPFYSTMKRKENEHFYMSIYDINRELEFKNESAVTDELGLRPQD